MQILSFREVITPGMCFAATVMRYLDSLASKSAVVSPATPALGPTDLSQDEFQMQAIYLLNSLTRLQRFLLEPCCDTCTLCGRCRRGLRLSWKSRYGILQIAFRSIYQTRSDQHKNLVACCNGCLINHAQSPSSQVGEPKRG